MGRRLSMSAFTSRMHRSWSGVSSKGKDASSFRCQGVSGEKAKPCWEARLAYRAARSTASFLAAARAFWTFCCHSPPPNLLRAGAASSRSEPMYFCIRSS